jgi:hypothetical protein
MGARVGRGRRLWETALGDGFGRRFLEAGGFIGSADARFEVRFC